MADSTTATGGSGGGDTAARMTSSFVKVGDRTRFMVEIRPGETTIVSWKKLLKDAARSSATTATATAASVPAPVEAPPVNAPPPSLESRLAPGQPTANESKDEPAPNRFSAVIEKIERLYMGKDSSDDEDMGDIPDDDQYDTEDSFIDDAELDEYFEVDKSKTKHDGFFVNRGTLEKVNERVESANQQPKKRRRKAPGDNDNGQHPNKHLKVGRKGAGKSVEKNALPTSQGPVEKIQNNSFGTYHQNMASDKHSLDFSSALRSSNGAASSTFAENSDKQKSGMLPAKNHSSKLKENSAQQSDMQIQQKDKSGMRERIDLNLPDSRHIVQHTKNPLLPKKEGSSVKPKANLLERAIRELDKMVAELRPPTVDAQDADASAQAIKRRLPREIKLKLAKVARLANASNGKVSNELLNRLMGILGHLCQIRTLKRHLKIMVDTSLSAKQEKDDKFQQIKKEVTEMVKTRMPSLTSKVAEPQSGGAGDAQEAGHSEKALKGQLSLDAVLEDKLCDLYDIFVDGLDEDAAPQVRKLYAELAELWPKGVMDNHGIKRAICRAKERKRTQNERNKQDEEKIKRKKVIPMKIEETVRVESSSAGQLQNVELRLATDPGIAAVSQQSRLISTTSPAAATAPTNVAASMPLPSANMPNFDRSKHEKVKGVCSSSLTDVRITDETVVKKKVKKSRENPGEGHYRPEKLASHQGDDRPKQHKHVAAPPLHGATHNKSSFNDFRFEPLT